MNQQQCSWGDKHTLFYHTAEAETDFSKLWCHLGMSKNTVQCRPTPNMMQLLVNNK